MKQRGKAKRLITFAAMAVVRYAAAAATGAGALFVGFLSLGVVGEIGLWAALIRRLRGAAA